MWLTLFVSHNEEQIKRLLSVLRANNIITKVIRRNSDEIYYEVYVVQCELEEAQNLIFEEELFN